MVFLKIDTHTVLNSDEIDRINLNHIRPNTQERCIRIELRAIPGLAEHRVLLLPYTSELASALLEKLNPQSLQDDPPAPVPKPLLVADRIFYTLPGLQQLASFIATPQAQAFWQSIVQHTQPGGALVPVQLGLIASLLMGNAGIGIAGECWVFSLRPGTNSQAGSPNRRYTFGR